MAESKAGRGTAVVVLLGSLLLLAFLTLGRARPADSSEMREFTGLAMGTTYSVKIDHDMSTSDLNGVRARVRERLDRLNGLMSTYDSTSELSRFNRYAGAEPFRVSPELIEVLTVARGVSEDSDGAFDVTVAPLVDAWGFGPAGMRRVPQRSEIETLQAIVGYRRIVVDASAGTVTKTRPETTVDLSAIAKGYAVGQVADGLVELGYERFLVELGGEIEAAGTRRDGSAWRIGIESPDPDRRIVHVRLALQDEAVATSGDYRNFFEEDGVRYAHIIDPRTGRPVRSHGFVVSVLDDRAVVADAWATALAVLGPDAGYEVARRHGIAAMFISRTGDSPKSLESRVTPAFEAKGRILAEVGEP